MPGAVLPRALETFADQPWLRTTAIGYHPEPAQRFRSTRFVTQQRGLGAPLEKYREDSTRVNETEQPDAVSRYISHAQASVPAYPGIPPCVKRSRRAQSQRGSGARAPSLCTAPAASHPTHRRAPLPPAAWSSLP